MLKSLLELFKLKCLHVLYILILFRFQYMQMYKVTNEKYKQACSSPCVACFGLSSTKCYSCVDEYYIDGNECKNCISPCKKCNGPMNT